MSVVILLLAALASWPESASATLIGQDATVTFIEPGFPDEMDIVTVGLGNEIEFGDATNIGGTIMLFGEYIDIVDASILYNVRGDGPGGTTGFGADARYVFSNLSWGPGMPGMITGVTVALSNVSGVAVGSEVFFTANSVTLYVDTLTVGEIVGAPDLGQITLNLQVEHVTPVPEPPTILWLALGATGIGLYVRRRKLSRG